MTIVLRRVADKNDLTGRYMLLIGVNKVVKPIQLTGTYTGKSLVSSEFLLRKTKKNP